MSTTSIGIDMDTKTFKRMNAKFLLDVEEVLPVAARFAIKRGQIKATTEIVKAVKPQLNQRRVKAKDIKAKLKTLSKYRLKGKDIASFEVTMTMPNRGFAMSRFLMGRKTPASQKGKTSGRKGIVNPAGAPRKRVRVKISQGKETALKKAYLAKGKGTMKSGPRVGQQNYQVFMNRNSGKRTALASQSIASLSSHFLPKIKDTVAKHMRRTFEREFRRRVRIQNARRLGRQV